MGKKRDGSLGIPHKAGQVARPTWEGRGPRTLELGQIQEIAEGMW
jgi:hypothetical protein